MSSSPGDNDSGDQRRLIDAAWRQIEDARSGDGEPSTQVRGAQRALAGRLALFPDELPGYRILDEIHRGGQGVVYQAVQESTGRDVAIKVMLGGAFAGQRERARFEREVQILARLKHPNIVTIHDSGAAGSATYFVMDYIAGAPLDAYAQRENLTLRQRLELFGKVCRAVDVAHLRGVIHRDLKPGNIRVDDSGEPHILDFGLAKQASIDAEAADLDALTLTGQFVGSLPWASPEQARGRSDEVDLRTDVYSLGVMLYQMLTGEFPYDIASSLTETAHNIIHAEPRPPRGRNRELDDEVCTIVLKALRKERELRYQSAGAFGRDIERYLAGEPIEAKRDSFSYIVRKTFARHKVVLGVASAFVLAITIGFVVSLSLWQQALSAQEAEALARTIAQDNAAEAERAAGEATAINEFLIQVFAAANPLANAEASGVKVVDLLDDARAKLDAGSLVDQPRVAAALRSVLGRTYATLGDYERGMSQLLAARELYSGPGGVAPTDHHRLELAVHLAEMHHARGEISEAEASLAPAMTTIRDQHGEQNRLYLQALSVRAGLARDQGDLESAVNDVRRALEIAHTLTAQDPAVTAELRNDYAVMLHRLGRLDEAYAQQRTALALYRGLYGENHVATATALSNLGGIEKARGNYDEGAAYFERALEISRAILGPEHPNVASCLNAWAQLEVQRQQYRAAEPLLAQALELRRKLLGADHPHVAHTLNNLAITQYRLGKLRDAADNMRESLRIFREAYGEQHPSVAALMGNFGVLLHTLGDVDEAATLLEQVLEIQLARPALNDLAIATARHNLAKVLLDSGDATTAEELLRAARETRARRLPPGDPDLLSTIDLHAGSLQALGRFDEAEALMRDVLARREQALGERSAACAESLSNLAGLSAARGRFADAVDLYRGALAITEEALSPDHWKTVVIRTGLGAVLTDLQQFEDAERVLTTAHECAAAGDGAAHPRTLAVVDALVTLYEAWGREADAASWRARMQSSE